MLWAMYGPRPEKIAPDKRAASQAALGREHVDCRGCGACCHQVIVLTPADLARRDWAVIPDTPQLQRRNDGSCVYFLPGLGCGIHAEAPDMCRAFHCGYWYRWLSESERSRMMVFGNEHDRRMIEAGRKRVP